MEGSPTEFTALLREWRGGDSQALDRLLPRVYAELRALAAGYLAGERPGHTLQATALVHEAYLRLAGSENPWQDRAHFFAVAAGTMRRILVDHARARSAAKRGGGEAAVTLDEALMVSEGPREDLLLLDSALEKLAAFDPRKSRVVELRYFGGLNAQEIGEVLGIGTATVQRDLRMARAWLHRELDPGLPATDGG